MYDEPSMPIQAAMIVQGIMLIWLLACSVFFFRRRSQSRNVRAFSYVCAAAFLWSAGQYGAAFVTLYFPNETLYFWMNKLIYAGMCALVPTSVFLAWVYCGKYRLYTNKRLCGFLAGIAAFFYVAILTDPLHHLYYRSFSLQEREYAPLMIVFTIWAYASFLYALVMIVDHYGKRQSGILGYFLLCFAMPLTANTLSIFIRDNRYDVTVPCVCVMMAGALLIVYRCRAVNISPIAAQRILAGLSYPVAVLAPAGAVLFRNGAAWEIPDFEALCVSQEEETIAPGNGCVYRPKRMPTSDGNCLLALVDITAYTEMLAELDSQSAKLKSLQKAFVEQMKAVEEYAAIAETYAAQRSRLEIMSRLNSQVYSAVNQILENTGRALAGETPEEEAIRKNIALTIEGIRMVRRVIDEYKEVKRYGL